MPRRLRPRQAAAAPAQPPVPAVAVAVVVDPPPPQPQPQPPQPPQDHADEHYIYTGKRTRDGMRVNVEGVSVGDFVSCTQTYRVTGKGNGHVSLRCVSNGSHSDVRQELIAKEVDDLQHQEEVKVSRREMAAVCRNARGSVVQFHFFKKPTDARGAQLLDGADLSSAAKRRRVCRDILRGEERTMKCVVKGVNDQGRADVVDLEVDGPHNSRQVDLRTVDVCVFRGRKYKI